MVAEVATQKIRIRMKAYDFKLLDQSAGEILDTAVRTGARVAGERPRPRGRGAGDLKRKAGTEAEQGY